MSDVWLPERISWGNMVQLSTIQHEDMIWWMNCGELVGTPEKTKTCPSNLLQTMSDFQLYHDKIVLNQVAWLCLKIGVYIYIHIYIYIIYTHIYIYIYYIIIIYIYIYIINTYTPTFDGFSVSRQAWCQVSSAPVCPPIGPQRKCRCTTSSTLLWTTPQSRRRARGAWTPQPSGNPNLGSQKLMLNGVNNLKIYGVKWC